MLNKRVLSSFVLSIYLVTELNIAFADPFEAGKNTGSSSTNSIYSGITSGGNTSSLPSFGSSSSTNLQSNYPGKGRDDVNSITGLMQQGTSIKNETCSDDDMSCAGRKMVSKKYESSGSNPYKGMAQDMRSDAQNLDPEAILGMNNLPTEGASTVCIEEETTLPPSTEVKTCLDATLQQTTIFTKLPTTVGHEYTSPICIDPEYTLNSDKSLCIQNYYSCPNGGELDGTECVKTTEIVVAEPAETDVKYWVCREEDYGKVIYGSKEGTGWAYNTSGIECSNTGELKFYQRPHVFSQETNKLMGSVPGLLPVTDLLGISETALYEQRIPTSTAYVTDSMNTTEGGSNLQWITNGINVLNTFKPLPILFKKVNYESASYFPYLFINPRTGQLGISPNNYPNYEFYDSARPPYFSSMLGTVSMTWINAFLKPKKVETDLYMCKNPGQSITFKGGLPMSKFWDYSDPDVQITCLENGKLATFVPKHQQQPIKGSYLFDNGVPTISQPGNTDLVSIPTIGQYMYQGKYFDAIALRKSDMQLMVSKQSGSSNLVESGFF